MKQVKEILHNLKQKTKEQLHTLQYQLEMIKHYNFYLILVLHLIGKHKIILDEYQEMKNY